MKDKKQYRSFTVTREAINQDERTVQLAFSSEEMALQWFGYEILDHSPESIRLGRLRDGAPLLMDHDACDQIGVVESVEIRADRVGSVVVRFGNSKRANEIFQDVMDGIRRKVSVGYQIHSAEKTGVQDDKPVYRVTDWEPYEISIVAIPADNTVGVGRQLEIKEEQINNENKINLGDQMSKEQVVQNVERSAYAQDESVFEQRGVEMERKRVNEITQMGQNLKDHGGLELAREFINNGKSADDFSRALVAKMGEGFKPVPSGALDLDKKDVQRFSLLRLMGGLAGRATGDMAAFRKAAYEMEVCNYAAERSGKSPKGVFIPVDVLRHDYTPEGGKRDLTVGTSTAGGHLVATNLISGSFIELLRNRMLIQRLGATTLNDLVGNIAIPRQTSGATAYWVAEGSAPTESQQAVDQVTMGPKSLAAFTDFSRKLFLQSSIDVENMVKNDLARVLGLAIDYAALYGSGSSNQPTGVKNVSGINTVDFAAAAPTFAEIVQLETEVAADNADLGSLAYAVNATGRGGLKTTEKASSTGQFIWEPGNTVNGYRAEASNQVASGDFWFGNWSDLILGFWSGLDLLVDPYTASSSGNVRVTAFQDVDIAVRHPVSFCRGNNTL
jgi:HK97 family phage major capsid protein/HK97 family phage prohead protease